jgi:hypothetical protein
MIVWKGNANMFKDWTPTACPVIPTNLTPYANAGIALEIRKHTPPHEFEQKHKANVTGGLMEFSNGKFAWDLPTKYDLNPGSISDIALMERGLLALYHVSRNLRSLGIGTILLPKIGSGLGRLNWSFVWECLNDLVNHIASLFTVNIYAKEPK